MQTILRSIHSLLVRSAITRRWERRLARQVKSICGVPDAFGDLFAIARRHQPTAILDVGAFQGSTVLRFVDELPISVHAFEPTPESFQVLQQRFRNHRRVHLYNVAFAEKAGTASFHCNQNLQTNSLLDNDDGNLRNFPEYVQHVQKITIRTETLDRWLQTTCRKAIFLLSPIFRERKEGCWMVPPNPFLPGYWPFIPKHKFSRITLGKSTSLNCIGVWSTISDLPWVMFTRV